MFIDGDGVPVSVREDSEGGPDLSAAESIRTELSEALVHPRFYEVSLGSERLRFQYQPQPQGYDERAIVAVANDLLSRVGDERRVVQIPFSFGSGFGVLIGPPDSATEWMRRFTEANAKP